MKKQFFRVKQLADQTFSRAGKTEALSDDLVLAERRIEDLQKICQNVKKIVATREKRNKKVPDQLLFENGSDDTDDVMRLVLIRSSQMHVELADSSGESDARIENNILKPIIEIMDVDIPNIIKKKRELTKLILDMDSAKNRYQTALKHVTSSTSTGSVTKVDSIKDELEELEKKVDQCRDTLASEMYGVISKEPVIVNLLLEYVKLQQASHISALSILDKFLPVMQSTIDDGNLKPVFSFPLEDHLRTTGRRIAYPLELCVCVLLELGMEEEGIFRVSGGAGKVRRLRSGLDVKLMTMETAMELRDCHVFADVLKKYMRELPEPLLTFDLYEEWLVAIRHSADENEKLSALRTVLHKLPAVNYDNLRYLIKFLARLSKNQEINKMTTQNIGIVIAPSLIWKKQNDSCNMGENMSFTNLYTAIVECLVRNADWFFPGEEKFYVTIEDATTRVKKHTRSNSADLRLLNVEFTMPSDSLSIKRCQSTTSLEEQIQNCPLPESPKPMNRTRKNKPAPIPPISNNTYGSPSGAQKDKANVTNKTSSITQSHRSHFSDENSPTSANVTINHQESFNFKELSEKLEDSLEQDDNEDKSRSRSPRVKIPPPDDGVNNISNEVTKLLSSESLNKMLESKKVTKPIPAPRVSLERPYSDEVTPRKPMIPEKPTSLQRPMSCTFKSLKVTDAADFNKPEVDKTKGPSLEKAHLYSVDKQQVSFIEIASSPDESSSTESSVSINQDHSTLRSRSSFSSSDNRVVYEKHDNSKTEHHADSGQNSSHTRALSDGHNIEISNTANLPPHRNFHRIQRPIPPPPPPPIVSKSQVRSGSFSDSTNL